MIPPTLVALVTVSSTAIFVGTWFGRMADSDNMLVTAVAWIVPSFVMALIFTALCLSVFYPLTRFVALLVG
jgi:hypothetical protein